jgi:hypothetical protein
VGRGFFWATLSAFLWVFKCAFGFWKAGFIRAWFRGGRNGGVLPPYFIPFSLCFCLFLSVLGIAMARLPAQGRPGCGFSAKERRPKGHFTHWRGALWGNEADTAQRPCLAAGAAGRLRDMEKYLQKTFGQQSVKFAY